MSAFSDVLSRLAATIEARKGGDAAASYTAKLLTDPSLAAKKLGEEAIEAVIAATQGDKSALAGESADLIYNLAVVWAASGVTPQDVWAEMDRREQMLGIAEKLPKTRVTTKASSPKSVAAAKPAAAAAVRRPVISLDARRAPKRR